MPHVPRSHPELTQHPYAYRMKTQQQTGKAVHTVMAAYMCLSPQNPCNFLSGLPFTSAAVDVMGCRGRTGNSQLPTIFLYHQLHWSSYTKSAYTSFGLPGPSAELSFVYPLHDSWKSLSVGVLLTRCARAVSKASIEATDGRGGGGATVSCGHMYSYVWRWKLIELTLISLASMTITFSSSNSCLVSCFTLSL